MKMGAAFHTDPGRPGSGLEEVGGDPHRQGHNPMNVAKELQFQDIFFWRL